MQSKVGDAGILPNGVQKMVSGLDSHPWDNHLMLGYSSRRGMAILGGAVLLAGCVQPRGLSYMEPAGPGKSYDLAVHVRNTPDIGYNPEVDEDRVRLAKRIAKPHCGKSQVAGEAKFNTEVWAITSSLPDYVVYLKCI